MAEISILGLPELLLPLDSVFLLALSVLGSKVGWQNLSLMLSNPGERHLLLLQMDLAAS